MLREQIPVFWTTINITLLIRKINDIDHEKDMFFEKGTFVIPFTKNRTTDAKLIAIIHDYNHSSEIEKDKPVAVPIFLLSDQLSKTETYELSEAKMALYSNRISIGEICFIDIADKCGFLDYELLRYNNVKHKLNNSNFNVIMWPAAESNYGSYSRSSAPHSFLNDLIYNVSYYVRRFVEKGGGYIGACYGAYRASCGIPLLSDCYLKRYYDPNLQTKIFLAISDVIIGTYWRYEELLTTKVKIVNFTHPVTYGLDAKLEIFPGGPVFLDVGKNSQIISRFYDTCWKFDGTPAWISSRFGNGRVVIFSNHPEITAYMPGKYSKDGRTIMINSLFYTTSKGKTELSTTLHRNLSFICEILVKTTDLSLEKSEGIFNEIISRINVTIVESHNLLNLLEELTNRLINISENKSINHSHLGSKSMYSRRYLSHFIDYLPKARETLLTLEKIYPILKNDSYFVQQIEALRLISLQYINKTQEIYSNIYQICQIYNNYLDKYENVTRPKRSLFWEFRIQNKAHAQYWQAFEALKYVPQLYFSSLKLLRSSWYNYEANVAF